MHLYGLSLPLSSRPVAVAVVVEVGLVSAVDEKLKAENARVAAVDDAKAVASRGNLHIRPHLKERRRRPARRTAGTAAGRAGGGGEGGSGQRPAGGAAGGKGGSAATEKERERGRDQRSVEVGRALASAATAPAELSRRRRSAAQSPSSGRLQLIASPAFGPQPVRGDAAWQRDCTAVAAAVCSREHRAAETVAPCRRCSSAMRLRHAAPPCDSAIGSVPAAPGRRAAAQS